MKKMLVVAITLIASLSSFAQETSAYWSAYYNRKNDPETWKKVSNMSEKQLLAYSSGKEIKEDTIEKKPSSVYFAFNAGLKNTIGFELVAGKQVVIGIGIDYYVGKGAVGKDYSTIFNWTKYSSDVYEHITTPTTGIYVITGYRFLPKLSVQSNVGIYTNTTYHNGYDRSRILSTNGYYYTSSDAGIGLLYGGSLTCDVNKFGVYVGYNNMSGMKFGVIYSF